jgi:hypothetical protein
MLGVISSSPGELQPVFDAIVGSGLKLFPGAAISIALAEGDQVKAVAVAAPDPAGVEALQRRMPYPLTRGYITSTAILESCDHRCETYTGQQQLLHAAHSPQREIDSPYLYRRERWLSVILG